jgi:hypothetical protein
MAAFIRFVTTRVHKDSHRQEGVFAAAYALLDSGSLDQEEWCIGPDGMDSGIGVSTSH